MNDRFHPSRRDSNSVGVVLVDHGSRRKESNAIVVEVASRLCQIEGVLVVEPAHMELAEPSLASAFSKCAERGVRHIIVVPYFLGPGRHVEEDIPRLAADAARKHAGMSFVVAAPFGLHPLIPQIVEDRAMACLSSGQAKETTCANQEDPPDVD